jgi:hypothetical protein
MLLGFEIWLRFTGDEGRPDRSFVGERINRSVLSTRWGCRDTDAAPTPSAHVRDSRSTAPLNESGNTNIVNELRTLAHATIRGA